MESVNTQVALTLFEGKNLGKFWLTTVFSTETLTFANITTQRVFNKRKLTNRSSICDFSTTNNAMLVREN